MKISKETNVIKEIYQNERIFVINCIRKFDLNQINNLKNKVDSSYQNLYKSDFWQKLNYYPEVNLNHFQPIPLFELQTKLRFDEQLIYLRISESIYAIGISH